MVKRAHVDTALFGRVLAEDVKVGSKKMALAGDELDDELSSRRGRVRRRDASASVRSSTCEAEVGVCAACYGR